MPRHDLVTKQLIRHPKELPPCPGPKLRAFPHHDSEIRWLERIDEDTDATSESSGKQAYVFKVEIESQTYALKVFKFFNPDESRDYWEPLVEESGGRSKVEYHTDPFFAECRAYGRIHQEKRRGAIKEDPAIPCFGFIYLGSEHRRILERNGVDLEEYCLEDDSSSSIDAGSTSSTLPIRGIVKKLASSRSGLNDKSVGRMLKNIKQLNKLKIYNRDIRKDNFRDGKLVDFGSAWTEPHCLMQESNSFEASETRLGDLIMFDEMVDAEGIFSRWRGMPNWQYKRKLRPRR